MRKWHPINWIQWLTLALALFTVATVIILFTRLSTVQARIQQERHDSIISSCEDQNRRHDKTLAQLNSAKAKADAKFNKAHPGDKAAQEANAKSTAAGVATFALIFNASTPHRDCAALAAKYVTH